MADKALKPLAGVVIALLIIGFSPLVDAESGWKSTLGEIVWWSIIVTGVALLTLGAVAYAGRRSRGRHSVAR
jgi:hypothetical protein